MENHDDKNEKVSNIVGWILGIFVLGSCFLVLIGIFLGFVMNYYIDKRHKANLTPLTPETKEYLCDALEIKDNLWRCNPKREVYSIDFYYDVKDRISPKEGYWVTYEEVIELFGKFELGCSTYEESPSKFCYYDFSYEMDDPITIIFDLETGIVEGVYFLRPGEL